MSERVVMPAKVLERLLAPFAGISDARLNRIFFEDAPDSVARDLAGALICARETVATAWALSLDISRSDVRLEMSLTLGDVEHELHTVEAKWPPFSSAHEGWGVLLEEIRELEHHVYTNQSRRDLHAMRSEAVQIAATATRFAYSVCDEHRGRK